MRAARLLDLVLILQRRGRVTARALARELEVSERTILRDVEALGMAGIPVVSVPGHGGGIELIDGFRTQLTGLVPEEAATVFLAGQPRLAQRLGLAAPARSARQKLTEALPESIRSRPDELDVWFLHDPDPWAGHRIPYGELRRLARAIERGVVVELTMADHATTPAIAPLGIVHKAGTWHLVGVDVGHPSGELSEVTAIDLSRLLGTRITRRPSSRPEGFHLASWWDRWVARSARAVDRAGGVAQ